MAIQSSGILTQASTDPDKSSVGAIGTSTDGSAVTFTPGVTLDSLTCVNLSNMYIRATITWAAGVNNTGDNTFLIAPNGSTNMTFQDINAADDTNAIDGVDFVAISPPASGFELASAATPVLADPANAFQIVCTGIES